MNGMPIVFSMLNKEVLRIREETKNKNTHTAHLYVYVVLSLHETTHTSSSLHALNEAVVDGARVV